MTGQDDTMRDAANVVTDQARHLSTLAVKAGYEAAGIVADWLYTIRPSRINAK